MCRIARERTGPNARYGVRFALPAFPQTCYPKGIMTQDQIQGLYAETAEMLSTEHREAAAEIRQGALALKEAIAARSTAEKRSSLIARLFNGDV